MKTRPRHRFLASTTGARALAVLAWLVCSALFVGCNKSQEAPPAATGASAASTEARATAAPSASGIILQANPSRAALGEACKGDQSCQAPLRCMDDECVVPPAIDGVVSASTPRLLIDTGDERPVRIYLEVAIAGYERQRGLMWRERMASGWGMLFVSPKARVQSFWMQNTYLPLDMVFIATDGTIVNIAANAKPLDTGPRYESTGAARYVLELNAGAAAELGIAAGQQVRLVDVPGQHDPMILN